MAYLYKYEGYMCWKELSKPDAFTLVDDACNNQQAASNLIFSREKPCPYMRVAGPDQEGDWYFDYGSYSSFYLLTNEKVRQ